MHKHKQNRRTVPWSAMIAVSFCLAGQAQAEVTVSGIFGNGMVLQQEMPIPVWGWAAPGEAVTVQFDREKAEAKADADGNWKVTLPARKADGQPHTLAARGAKRP